MNLDAVIDTHREALKRIVATLVAMVGGQFTLFPQEGAAASRLALAEKSKLSPAPTLPRRLHRAVLRLLRPADSAARRMAITLARGLPSLPAREIGAVAGREAKGASIFVRTRIVRRPAPISAHPAVQAPSNAALRPLSFPLLDPLPRLRRWRPVAAGVPRVCIPGVTGHLAVPARKPPMPDDPLDAGRLCRRLAALARALDDLPGQAKRFVRWQARRDRALAAGRIHRVTPLRGGRPPGGRLSRYQPDARRRRNIREVDEILAHAHALAHHALSPDTS